ncbi:MAG: 3-deoxy-8-phosphooctulonate synthase [bacterium]|nr:3-deoxy-8-phosphooctulonate synthase [bacterium]
MTFSPLHCTVSPKVTIGGPQLVLIAGPCVIESETLVLSVAEQLKTLCAGLPVAFIFKSSFDKANRTSASSYRGLDFDSSMRILQRVRDEVGVPVLTDVHECAQVDEVAAVADVLQIPAFLCRQTDLIQACARTGKAVNIKKGQFAAPEDMRHAVEKVRGMGNPRVCLTERGTTFGYHNLVVDMRSLVIMRHYAPVIFDATHSVQQPGGRGETSGGQREFAAPLARAAAAVGVAGFFVETHPHPEAALSDGPNMIPLTAMPAFIDQLIQIHELGLKE